MAVDDKADEVSIGVTAFKARCLALIEEVAQGKTYAGEPDPYRAPRVDEDDEDEDEDGAEAGKTTAAADE